MHTFTSDTSKKKFPISERVGGKSVRVGILKEIQKECPEFNDDCALSVSEFNHYRQLYVKNLLSKEVGTLTELEQTVLDNINHNHLIADEASEIKNPGTRGQRWADRIASFGGSWRFLSIFGLFLLAWMVLNILALRNNGFDPYPFILLNLILSCIAAVQAPVIMMSQNRQEQKDRERAKNDYMVNLKSELEIRMLHEKIDHLLITQEENLVEMQQVQIDLMNDLMKKIDSKI
ncbi:MAG: DUF1003 domain-containing protein [Ginsengibacter sp.]